MYWLRRSLFVVFLAGAAGGLLVLLRPHHQQSPSGTDGATPLLQYGYGIQYKDFMYGILGRLPEDSWVLSGSENRDLTGRIARAVQDAAVLDPAMGLADMGLLYVRPPTAPAYTVTLTLDDKRRTVYLGHGTRESRKLYGLLLEARRKSGGLQQDPWPEDVLTVPHNKWLRGGG